MAAIDPCRCKFFTVAPCFAEGAGSCDALFCFFSTPRCRFCNTLYNQQLVFPWHWMKKGRKTDYIGSTEKSMVSAIMFFVSKLFAPVTLFIFLGSAHFRRDFNQAVKGVVNFALFSVGFSSMMFLGPFALIFIVFMFLADTVIDWFMSGRCNDCWEYKCTGLFCCFGGTLQEGQEPKLPKAMGEKTKRVKEYKAIDGGPSQDSMEGASLTRAYTKEEMEYIEEAEGGGGAAKAGMCCCICCLLIFAAIGWAMYPLIMSGIDKAGEMAGMVSNATGVSLDNVTGSVGLYEI